MSKIIQFPQKEDQAFIYSFAVNYENYLLIFHEDKKTISYAKSEVTEEGELIPLEIPQEEANMLFKETYPVFFLDVLENDDEEESESQTEERYVSVLFFDFEDKRYCLYYHEEQPDLPMLIFLIEDGGVVKIDNEFSVKRIVKFIDDNFELDIV